VCFKKKATRTANEVNMEPQSDGVIGKKRKMKKSAKVKDTELLIAEAQSKKADEQEKREQRGARKEKSQSIAEKFQEHGG
jgi:hypothetical protein